ncbi:MAG TPA: hypothetical protein VKZ83_00615, partial [Phototrophicaceae bacterium]|nr:hypothetical protein [Phototrophicaceae bacterium]
TPPREETPMLTAHRIYPEEALAALDLDPTLPVSFVDDGAGGVSYRQGETGPWLPAYEARDYEFDGDVARAFLADLADLAASADRGAGRTVGPARRCAGRAVGAADRAPRGSAGRPFGAVGRTRRAASAVRLARRTAPARRLARRTAPAVGPACRAASPVGPADGARAAPGRPGPAPSAPGPPLSVCDVTGGRSDVRAIMTR